MPDFKKKKNIVHTIEWVVAVLAGIMISDLFCFNCGRHVIRNQFIDASIYGYFIVSTLLFLAICVDEDIPEKTGYALSALGAVLYFLAGVLLIVAFDDLGDYLSDASFFRLLMGCVLCLINFIIYTVEFFISLFKSELLD